MNLTGEQRQEAARLCGEATAGPWAVGKCSDGKIHVVASCRHAGYHDDGNSIDEDWAQGSVWDDSDDFCTAANKAFIANARTTLPAALEDIAELEGKLEIARKALEDILRSLCRTAPLDRLRALALGWDSYSGKPIDERALKTAEAILSTQGQVVPCSNGGVQVEWHCGGVDVEICIGPDGAVEEDAHPDTERLDWIENCPGGISVSSGGVKIGQKPDSWIVDVWNEEDGVTRQTLRAAIDAARADGKKEG